MTTLSIQSLKFKAGSDTHATPLELDIPTVTVFVGPNNSGKSLALREIESWCWNDDSARNVVATVSVIPPSSSEECDTLLEPFVTDPPKNQTTPPDSIWIGLPVFRGQQPVLHEQINLNALHTAASGNDTWLRHGLLRFYTVRLDGRTRFTLSDPKPSGDLQGHPQNHLWALFQNDDAREQVRKFTEAAFGRHFVIDPTAMTQFRVRLSDRKPSSTQEEQSLDATARNFHAQASLVQDMSDGVQAFSGLISAVMSLPHRIILIDEPEAFLHPPLARRLGQNLSEIAEGRNANLLVATHSAEFLMGCIEATSSLTIVRLTYDSSAATAMAVSPEDIQELMTDPLLRSVTALRGLFHRGVAICEADRDRAFYEEINHRLIQSGKGVQDVLFANAQNWQTIPRIAIPLRKLGIPAFGIMDFDVIAAIESWNLIYEMLAADSATEARIRHLKESSASVLNALPLDSNDKKQFKMCGIDCVSGEARSNLEELLKLLADHGLFVVPVGQVENWLRSFSVHPDPKKTWLIRMFAKIGDEPNSASYAQPSDDDVWKFINQTENWVSEATRKGMP